MKMLDRPTWGNPFPQKKEIEVDIQSFADFCTEMDNFITIYNENKTARMFSSCPSHPVHTYRNYFTELMNRIDTGHKMEWRNDGFYIEFNKENVNGLYWLQLIQFIHTLKANEVNVYADSLVTSKGTIRLEWD